MKLRRCGQYSLTQNYFRLFLVGNNNGAILTESLSVRTLLLFLNNLNLCVNKSPVHSHEIFKKKPCTRKYLCLTYNTSLQLTQPISNQEFKKCSSAKFIYSKRNTATEGRKPLYNLKCCSILYMYVTGRIVA